MRGNNLKLDTGYLLCPLPWLLPDLLLWSLGELKERKAVCVHKHLKISFECHSEERNDRLTHGQGFSGTLFLRVSSSHCKPFATLFYAQTSPFHSRAFCGHKEVKSSADPSFHTWILPAYPRVLLSEVCPPNYNYQRFRFLPMQYDIPKILMAAHTYTEACYKVHWQITWNIS